MTMFYFVRHGEATYQPVDERCFIGHGRDLAPLTQRGVKQIKEASKDIRLRNCEIVVSSPYTRALQSSSIISRELDIDIAVEIDLHEWLPDKTFQYRTSEEAFSFCKDFYSCNGKYPKEERKWETMEDLRRRVERVLERYLYYSSVIVVCHGMVIRSITDRDIAIENGAIIEHCR